MGRERIIDHYSNLKTAQKIERLYENLLN